MPYGSSAYGASAYGGGAKAVNEQIFFPLVVREPDVLFEATGLFNGPEEFYEILAQQGTEPGAGPIGTEYKVYTSHGSGETPQLQVTFGGNSQQIIGAAPIIVVTVIIDGSQFGGGLDVWVRGRPYTH